MLKFNSWPPQPGQVELTQSFMTYKDRDASASSHYRNMGIAVGNLLFDNSTDKDLNTIRIIAEEIIHQDNLASRNNLLTPNFMTGVSTVMTRTTERSHA